MRLATIRTATGNRAVRVDADAAVETGEADVRALLERPDWAEHAAAAAGPGRTRSRGWTTRRWCRRPRRSSASG